MGGSMIRLCAWCGRTIGQVDIEASEITSPITHGICADCARDMLVSQSISLREYLNRFSGPVFLVGEGGRVVTANKDALSVLGRSYDDIEGRLGGDAFECVHSREPGGCGNTVHCKTCTIRRKVTDTMETGRSHFRVEAYPDLYFVTDERRIRFLISTEKIGDAVLLRIDEVAEYDPAIHGKRTDSPDYYT